MKVHPSTGPQRSLFIKRISYVVAAMLVLMLVGQLFSYENFPSALSTVLPFNDQPLTFVLSAVIVLVELFSLPYLLGMYISKLLRILSATSLILVALFWLVIVLTNAHAENVGLFSTSLKLSGGIVPAVWSFVIVLLSYKILSSDTKFRHDSPSDLR